MKGFLTLINATPYNWTLDLGTYDGLGMHSYQMTTWDPPATVNADSLVTITADLDQDVFQPEDDAADVAYTFTDSDGMVLGFQLHVRSDPKFAIEFTKLSTVGNPPGIWRDLGFRDNAWTPVFLSGSSPANFGSVYWPINWMEMHLSSIRCQNLRHLCLPGSHDAGMSQFHNPTPGTDPSDTETQTFDIGGQLYYGIRFFDIRPSFNNGIYMTHHHSATSSQACGYIGADGQPMDDVIADINDFLDARRNELVVLRLTASLNDDLKQQDCLYPVQTWTGFDQELWYGLLDKFVSDLHNKFGLPSWWQSQLNANGDLDLTTWPIDWFVSDGPAVLVIIDEHFADRTPVDLDTYWGNGIFAADPNFPLYDSWANDNAITTVQRDQYDKLISQRPNPDSEMFMLNYIFTHFTGDIELFATENWPAAVGSGTPPYSGIWQWTNPNTYPNVILVDNIGTDGNLVQLCMAINQAYSCCDC